MVRSQLRTIQGCAVCGLQSPVFLKTHGRMGRNVRSNKYKVYLWLWVTWSYCGIHVNFSHTIDQAASWFHLKRQPYCVQIKLLKSYLSFHVPFCVSFSSASFNIQGSIVTDYFPQLSKSLHSTIIHSFNPQWKTRTKLRRKWNSKWYC